MRPVRFVAVLPPPHTGMTAVSQAMRAAFEKRGEVRLYTLTRPPGLSDGAWSLRKHLGLTAALVKALVRGPGKSPVYMVLDSGVGAWGSAALALLARVGGAPIVVHHHVFSYFDRGSVAARLFFALAGNRALHLTLCACMKEQLHLRYGASRRALVVSNPGFVTVEPGQRSRQTLRRLGFLGNVSREKGVGLFMATVRRLADEGIHLEACIAGPVRDPALAAEIADFIAEAPDLRSAPGAVYGADKQAFLDSVDVLLFPSQYANEAQPVTIYEALAAGAPVLATARGCIPEQLPAEWVFSEERFVEQAAGALRDWTVDTERFARAAQSASTHWTVALRRSRQELSAALTEVAAL